MNPVGVMLERIDHGWAVTLTNGRELARFTGFGARRRAVHYLAGICGFSASDVIL